MFIKTNVQNFSITAICLIFLLTVSFSAQSSFPERWSLAEQLKEGDIAALVEIVGVSSQSDNKLIRKEATLKVIVDLIGNRKDAIIKVVSFNGIAGSDLGLDCVGLRAIVILKKAPKEHFGNSHYLSVNNYFSVYKINKGHVEGITDSVLSEDEALKILREKIQEQNLLNSRSTN